MDQVGGPSGRPDAPHETPHRGATVWHRIAASLVEMAIIAGILVRVLHVVSNAHGDHLDWHAFVGTFILVPVVLLALATVHLAQYPLPQWLWRAPAFALLESTVEALASLGLIYIGRERWGTGRAELSDWPAMAGGIFLTRFLMIALFALVLGLVAQFVRRRELTHERGRERAEREKTGRESTGRSRDAGGTGYTGPERRKP